ncbi:MAG: hypothetical protein ACFB16_11500 [Phormidesmis sp.]
MTAGKCETTRCGLCRFYSHEGRRGGLCTQLNVNVNAQWAACCLAASPFSSAAEEDAGIAVWEAPLQKEKPVLPALAKSKMSVLSTASM